jgi:hypothetical protein
MVWDWELSLVDSLEESRFTATVLTQETVTATVCKLHGGVGEKDTTVEDQGDRGDLDIARLLQGRQDTGGDTVGETVLVHLGGKTSSLIELLTGGGWLIFFWKRVSIGVEQLLIRWGCGTRGLALGLSWGLTLGGTLGVTGSFRCGNHIVR